MSTDESKEIYTNALGNGNILKHSKDNIIVEISSKQNGISSQNVVPPVKPKETKIK